MKKRKIALRNLAVLALLVSCFIACDKDFADIDSDIINSDNAAHFNIQSIKSPVIAYTKILEPIQTNGLPLNMLGVYKDPINEYGTTTASFVTEVVSSIVNPTFGENVVIDSVLLTIPYFSTPLEVTSEGVTIYELDSVFGNEPIKLALYENNYFLRDFNPTGDSDENQNYYSNMSTGIDMISPSQLEGTPIPVETAEENAYLNEFIPSAQQIRLTNEDDELTSRLIPSLRLHLDKDYWRTKIFEKEGEPELSNANNFNDYFRGIYFKAEALSDNGNLSLLNLGSTNSNITIYYSKDSGIEGGVDRVNSTYVLNFTGTRVNFISNNATIPQGNETTGDENLYIKGNQGSVAEIKLFNGDNIDEDNATDNAFEAFKNDFVETDVDGHFVSSKKLVNEANLVFYVNQDMVNSEEPNRIYIYDAENHTPLQDYYIDNTNTSFPDFSKVVHLGRLEREGDDATGQGIKYKIRITEHINNLLLNDSTNVKLGIAVSGNVNLENTIQQFDVLTGTDVDEKVPVSAIISPRGTVLYGNNTSIEEKKLYLEIFYTCQSTNNDCEEND